MNRDQKIKFKERQIRQKYDLLHILPSIGVKELSGLYLKNFYNTTKRYQLRLPTYLKEPDQKFCGECGYVQVPTHSVKIETTNINDDTDTKMNYTCIMCQHKYDEILETKTKRGFSRPLKNSDKEKAQVNKKVNSAKKRAKLRKQNSLTSMLSRKEQEKRNVNKTTSILSLESFLKK